MKRKLISVKRYHVILHTKTLDFNDKDLYAVWDESMGKFVCTPIRTISHLNILANKLNTEYEAYIKEVSDYLGTYVPINS